MNRRSFIIGAFLTPLVLKSVIKEPNRSSAKRRARVVCPIDGFTIAYVSDNKVWACIERARAGESILEIPVEAPGVGSIVARQPGCYPFQMNGVRLIDNETSIYVIATQDSLYVRT